jgi:hypothetical protein
MNHTMLNAGSVMNRCARFTVLSGSRLRDLASTVLISNVSNITYNVCPNWGNL